MEILVNLAHAQTNFPAALSHNSFPPDRKVFRIGLHATASKSSPPKALFSSVQEQSFDKVAWKLTKNDLKVNQLINGSAEYLRC
jgi:hypothetical protein